VDEHLSGPPSPVDTPEVQAPPGGAPTQSNAETGGPPSLPTTPTVLGMISLVLTGAFGLLAGLTWELGIDPAFAVLMAFFAGVACAGAVWAWMAACRHRPGDRDRLLRRATGATSQVMAFFRSRALLHLLGFALPDENGGRALYPPKLTAPTLRILAIAAVVATGLGVAAVAVGIVGRPTLLAGLVPALVTAALAFVEVPSSVRETIGEVAEHEASVAESALRATAVLIALTLMVAGGLAVVDFAEGAFEPARLLEWWVGDP
jgi:hypothetical protein